MKCSHCGNEIDTNDRFCQVCGCPIDQTAAAQAPVQVKIDKVGLCPHCGMRFLPDGISAYRKINVLNKIAMVIFAIFALFTLLVVILDAEGDAWMFALVTGIIYAGTCVLRARARARMAKTPCPHCGKNGAGEQVAAPQTAPQAATTAAAPRHAATAATPDRSSATPDRSSATPDRSSITPRRAELLAVYGNTDKTCARCGTISPMAETHCTHCGHRFGKLVPAIQEGHRVALTTCPGCGSVYATQKNILLALLLVGLSMLLNVVLMAISGMFLILSIPLMLVCFLLALLIVWGKLKWLPRRKCPTCHQTPFVISCIRHSRAAALRRDHRLLARRENALTRAFASCDNWLTGHITSANPFSVLLFLPVLLLILFVFVTPVSIDAINALDELTEYGISQSHSIGLFEGLTYVSEDGWDILLLLFLLVLYAASLVTVFIRGLRLRLIPPILGGLAMLDALILSIRVASMKDVNFTTHFMHEKVEIPVEFSAGLAPFGIILSTLLLLAGLLAAYMLEREKRYKLLGGQTD